jgi:hypothetical protein
MQKLTSVQMGIINHMQTCESAFSRKLSEREAANLYDENNQIIDTVTQQNVSIPTMTTQAILASLDQYKQILSQKMPKFERPSGP